MFIDQITILLYNNKSRFCAFYNTLGELEMWIPVAVMAAIFGLAAVIFYMRGRAYDLRLNETPKTVENQTVNGIQIGAMALSAEKSRANYSQASQLATLTALAGIAALIMFFMKV